MGACLLAASSGALAASSSALYLGALGAGRWCIEHSLKGALGVAGVVAGLPQEGRAVKTGAPEPVSWVQIPGLKDSGLSKYPTLFGPLFLHP